ncbi:uncharacterized protein [Procambarus clarkii]|uniref:uncharacterized protein n=1 Tax=Procambarus clarkii TaxID=6728 RepID=UPI001E6789EE|nr:uncharacterized protein LOC123762876 [Procambarus clarkii]XP_045605574.1 uncharacterized protein LOC123762876 [Procambarus clarkii]XP_045605583.1 uncharacterized protein LOC123762876 [Procambarus clarkii]XP_045605590.1 uncharacterized protein LOC123762876 [Procambarus clarkii]
MPWDESEICRTLATLLRMAPREEEMVIPSHTPKRLEEQALEKFISLVLQHSIPPSLHSTKFLQLQEFSIVHEHSSKLDKILTSGPEQIRDKTLLLTHLQQLKHWWENNEWLGKQNSEIRRHIKEGFTIYLELVDPHCEFPLFRFLLQLIFSTRVLGATDAAEFPDNPKMQIELQRNRCPVFAEVLKSLKPFGIEELSTEHIIFGNVEPWIIVVENSPFLKKVHLRKNICEEILLCIGQHCPLIDTFIVEQFFGRLMVPVDCLYKTFFSGLDYERVNTIAGSESHLSRQKYISFPRLKCVDMGDRRKFKKVVKRQSFTEFLYNLMLFYPNITSISCHTMQPFMPLLPVSLPQHCSFMTYNIKHIDLIGLMSFIHYCIPETILQPNGNIDAKSIILKFRKLQHLTLCHCASVHTSDDNIMEYARFAEIWIPMFGCKNLTIHVPFSPSEDIRNGEFLSLYIPLFSRIGPSLSALHFHLYTSINLNEICQLISLCPNLELLEIRLLSEVNVFSETNFHIKRLSRLTSLSFASVAVQNISTSIINTLAEKLITASPILTSMELMLAYRPCAWLMEIAGNKMLDGIKTLRLSFNARSVSKWVPNQPLNHVDTSFYILLIELLPNLEVLMLGMIHNVVFTQIRSIYRTSNLKIIARGKPYIGYALQTPI